MFDVAAAELRNIAHHHTNPDWHLAAHTHTCWEFVYFVRGSGKIDVPSARLSPLPYHLVVYPPGLPHAESSNPADPEETIFMTIDVPGDPPAGAHLLLPDTRGELGWLCSRLLEEHRMFGATPLARSYVAAFLHLVDRLWGKGVPVPHDSIDTVVQHINMNYAAEITLDSLASVACMSKTHLAHLFRTKLGTSPLRFLHQVRIESAKRLLGTTHMPVREVAAQVGFADPLYFSRAFRIATGQSPKAYRQQPNSTI